MDFDFTDEQRALLDTTRRFVAERYPFAYRERVRQSAAGWSRESWEQMAQLGLLALNVPETDGGLGAGPVEIMLACNALGEGLLLEPFISSAVIATRAIASLASAEQRARWLPAMATGELVAVLAHAEADAWDAGAKLQTRAVADTGGWRLQGRKALAYHAPAAGLLLVSASVAEDDVALFAIAPTTQGVKLATCTTVDGQCAAEIELAGVKVAPAARLGGNADGAIGDALDAGLAALCADAFGAMDRALATTVEYSRTRVQFGVPIGRFQALQHRMADMLVHFEQARSMGYLAASACGDADPDARHAALDAAKVLMGQAGRYIGQQAVQLHGGMGMTDELAVSHYFRRLLAFQLRAGTTAQRLERYRRQLQQG